MQILMMQVNVALDVRSIGPSSEPWMPSLQLSPLCPGLLLPHPQTVTSQAEPCLNLTVHQVLHAVEKYHLHMLLLILHG